MTGCGNVFSAIDGLNKKGMVFGMANTRALLDRIGSPDKHLKIIHIAGTNGKGSCAELFTRILIADGKKAGTFTSPEVYDFFDQFKVLGEPVSERVFETYFNEVLPFCGECTSFEVLTATALYMFYKLGMEYAVLECGMGGKDDATNAVLKKELAVICPISMEHTAYLGDTIEKICAQKSAIIKDCPAVVSREQVEEVFEYFKNLNAVFPAEIQITPNCSKREFVYRGKKFKFKDVPAFMQCNNAAVAIEGARILNLSERAIYSGIKHAVFYGRSQRILSRGRTYILDGAHNPNAFIPLVNYLKTFKEKPEIIFGCLSDKDIYKILEKISNLTDVVFAVKCPSPRAMQLVDIEEACKKYFKTVYPAESVESALDTARGKLVVVCGSFTLLKGAKSWIEKKL